MDTAKHVADLEHRLNEQQEQNEFLERQLQEVNERKEALELELKDLDNDNLLLQTQLQGEDSGKELDDEFVILRDIDTQTDQSFPADHKPITAPEQKILSLTSKLTFSNVIVETQKETISELERQLIKLDAEKTRIIQLNAETQLEMEYMQQINDQRAKIIEELWKRVERLEADFNSTHIRQTVSSVSKAGRKSSFSSISSARPPSIISMRPSSIISADVERFRIPDQ